MRQIAILALLGLYSQISMTEVQAVQLSEDNMAILTKDGKKAALKVALDAGKKSKSAAQTKESPSKKVAKAEKVVKSIAKKAKKEQSEEDKEIKRLDRQIDNEDSVVEQVAASASKVTAPEARKDAQKELEAVTDDAKSKKVIIQIKKKQVHEKFATEKEEKQTASDAVHTEATTNAEEKRIANEIATTEAKNNRTGATKTGEEVQQEE